MLTGPLLDCPFCGAEPMYTVRNSERLRITCSRCSASTRDGSSWAVVQVLWNTRFREQPFPLVQTKALSRGPRCHECGGTDLPHESCDREIRERGE